jgi:hypothetical protein
MLGNGSTFGEIAYELSIPVAFHSALAAGDLQPRKKIRGTP